MLPLWSAASGDREEAGSSVPGRLGWSLVVRGTQPPHRCRKELFQTEAVHQGQERSYKVTVKLSPHSRFMLPKQGRWNGSQDREWWGWT